MSYRNYSWDNTHARMRARLYTVVESGPGVGETTILRGLTLHDASDAADKMNAKAQSDPNRKHILYTVVPE